MQAIVNDVTRRITMKLNRLNPAKPRALVLATLLAGLGAGPIALGVSAEQPANTGQAAAAVAAVDAAKPAKPADTGKATDTGKVAAQRSEQAAKPASRAQARNVAPVAGLDQTQMDHAKTIVDTAHQMGLPDRAAVIAVATAMQESNLRNLANTGLPESEQLPHDGTGYDHDSVGLFQQRPASGWGPVDQLMDPATSARKFLTALKDVPGWQDMPVTVAAQTVQGSAFPDAYAKHQGNAEAVVDAITK
ncbi:MAG: hypothetical protein IRZ05_07390 [Micromonosporaceae bacterium]|nr:hypothetical protein [Micromonosporaceae bacterium]